MGGTDDIRRKVGRLLYELIKRFAVNAEGEGESSWLVSPSTTTATTPPATPREKTLTDDQHVAVVEPEEALDLL